MPMIDELEFDPEDFQITEDRLNVINHLKDKYGGSIEAVLEYRDEKEKELEKLEDLGAYREKLIADEKRLHEETLAICKKISDLRKYVDDNNCERLYSALLNNSSINFLKSLYESSI